MSEREKQQPTPRCPRYRRAGKARGRATPFSTHGRRMPVPGSVHNRPARLLETFDIVVNRRDGRSRPAPGGGDMPPQKSRCEMTVVRGASRDTPSPPRAFPLGPCASGLTDLWCLRIRPKSLGWRKPVNFLPTRNCTRWPTPSGQDRWRRSISHQRPRAIILMIPTAMVTGRWAQRAM